VLGGELVGGGRVRRERVLSQLGQTRHARDGNRMPKKRRKDNDKGQEYREWVACTRQGNKSSGGMTHSRGDHFFGEKRGKREGKKLVQTDMFCA